MHRTPGIIRLISALPLAALLCSAQAQAQDDAPVCSPTKVTGLGTKQTYVARNVKLLSLQQANTATPCHNNIDRETVLALHKAAQQITAGKLAGSKKAYELTVRFNLDETKPAWMALNTANKDLTDATRLLDYAEALAGLKDYHTTTGAAYLVLRYRVTPST